MTPALALEDVAVGYGDRVVVSGLRLRVEPGQIVGILGGNGSGKTTILRAVYGRARVFQGSFAITGLGPGPTTVQSLATRGMGILPQGGPVFPSLTVRENLQIAVRGPQSEFDRRLASVVEDFPEVGPLLSKTAGLLSGGERQIVGICRVLASEPRLLLLDEPAAGLSPPLVGRLLGRLAAIARGRQIATLVVEQHVSAAIAILDRLVMLRDGTQVFEGPAADLTPASAIALLLGRVS